jgi:hypothetical protein
MSEVGATGAQKKSRNMLLRLFVKNAAITTTGDTGFESPLHGEWGNTAFLPPRGIC